jgi:3-oxoacyl-[acyl-carrier-protein] synthase II
MAAGQVSITHGITGPLLSPSSACATGAHAIGDSFRLIKHGHAKIMVAGATEAAVNAISMAGFCQSKALTKRDDPSEASRPFDRDRDGFVIGEGAGAMILEELGSALERNAKIYGEVAGYGCTADAHHITASDPEGLGAVNSMKLALKEACLSDFDFVNAHATSTPQGDASELKAIDRFGKGVFVSANKGSIGHLLGAAGAVETIFALLSLKNGILPGNRNYIQGDDSNSNCFIIKENARMDFKVALKNSFGFGGTNVSLCLKKYVD